MIDIHCHILPNLDDGPNTMTESLAMAKRAVDDGITTIIATPHYIQGKYENTKPIIAENVHAYNNRLKEEDIPLIVLPGQEVRISGELIEEYDNGHIITIPNEVGYVLLELPSNHVPRYTKQLIYDLQLVGIKPILAHPERNSEFIESPDMLFNLVENGALTQVTAASITGHFGKNIQKFTRKIIDHNLTHFIASDAHNTTTRPSKLAEAYEEVERTFGKEYRYLFLENAELLIQGMHPEAYPPSRIRRKKVFGIF